MKCPSCDKTALDVSIDGNKYCINHGIAYLNSKNVASANQCEFLTQKGARCTKKAKAPMSNGKYACSTHNDETRCENKKCSRVGTIRKNGKRLCKECFRWNNMFSGFQQSRPKPKEPPKPKQTRQQDLATLNLTEPVTMEDIKKAFRLLALQYHPDKNPAESNKYMEIREAYDRLN